MTEILIFCFYQRYSIILGGGGEGNKLTSTTTTKQTGKKLHCKDESQSYAKICITFRLGELLQ